MKFFLDNNIAAKVARGLNELVSPEHQVVHFRDQFAAATADAVWMRQLAGVERWIIVTADIRIGKNPHELRVWEQTGQTIFFLKPGWLSMSFWDQAQKLVKCFPDIIRTAERAEKGAAFIVGVNGRIGLVPRR